MERQVGLACAHRHKPPLAPLLQRKAIPTILRNVLASCPSESGRRKYSDANLAITFNILERRVKATLDHVIIIIPFLLDPRLSIALLAKTDHGQPCGRA